MRRTDREILVHRQGEHLAVRIRLQRTGRKHQSSYRIVAVPRQSKRDGKVLEVLGHYDPLASEEKKQVVVNRERVNYWLGVGAQASDTVASLLKRAGVG